MTGSQALRTIQAIDPRPGSRLQIVWTGGTTSTVDFSASIAAGGVFAPLQDAALFEKVRVGPRRRTIEWPDSLHAEDFSIDIDADGLSAMSSSGLAPPVKRKARSRADRPVPPVQAKRPG